MDHSQKLSLVFIAMGVSNRHSTGGASLGSFDSICVGPATNGGLPGVYASPNPDLKFQNVFHRISSQINDCRCGEICLIWDGIMGWG
jgi:hypothetical protein